MEVREISSKIAIQFLLPKHYSWRVPNISKAFWWYKDWELVAVCTFWKPASPALCVWVCWAQWKDNVYELNRLCRVDELKEQLSEFVWECLRRLKDKDRIIVSYSDTAMNHHWYIYQATNFIYTWATKPRTDMYTPDGKHSRHYKHEEQTWLRKVRSSKHRYIYFCSYDKELKNHRLSNLKYPIMKYPKWDNSNYVLWNYIKDILVPDKWYLNINNK